MRESIDILRGEGPADTTALTLELARTMLSLGGKDPAEAERALKDGRGLERFRQIIEAQGGDPRVVDDPDRLPTATREVVLEAPRDGYVGAIDTTAVGVAGVCLGAGRAKKEDAIDPAVGLTIEARLGDRVAKGQPLVRVHHADRGVDDALARLRAAYRIDDAPPTVGPLVIDRIG